jgi:hypothetical protein
LPLSAVTAKLDVSPVISTSAASKSAFEVCPAPDTRWQSRQWHCAILTGFALATKRTAPHKHCPCAKKSLVIAASPPVPVS